MLSFLSESNFPLTWLIAIPLIVGLRLIVLPSYPSVKAVKDYVDFESLNDQTGTTYSLQPSDSGKVVTLNNASAITLTVPAGIPAGFNCTIVQKGVGAVSFVSGTGVTIANRLSRTMTAGQNAVATIVSISSNYFITIPGAYKSSSRLHLSNEGGSGSTWYEWSIRSC